MCNINSYSLTIKLTFIQASYKQYRSFTVKQILTKQNNHKVQISATFPIFLPLMMIWMKTGKSSKLEITNFTEFLFQT